MQKSNDAAAPEELEMIFFIRKGGSLLFLSALAGEIYDKTLRRGNRSCCERTWIIGN